MSRLRHFCIY